MLSPPDSVDSRLMVCIRLISVASTTTAAAASESRKERRCSRRRLRLSALRAVPDNDDVTRLDLARNNFSRGTICYTQENFSWLGFLLRVEHEHDSRTLYGAFRRREFDLLSRIPFLSRRQRGCRGLRLLTEARRFVRFCF